MELILILAPGSSQERTFSLRPGRNRLGSKRSSDIVVQASGILPSHLDIERKADAIAVASAVPEALFVYQGKPSRQAMVRPGEFFEIDGTPFFCFARSGPEKTELAVSPPPGSQSASRPLSQGPAPILEEVQISGFLNQHTIHLPMTIGRNPRCDLVLAHPQVSGFHARLYRMHGDVIMEDTHSSNGTFVSDVRIKKATLRPGDSIVIMPYFLIYTGDYLNVYTFQQESSLIGWQITVAAAAKKILDRVTISCNSNELVGLIGPSGSGKTTLMKCLSGQTMPAGGRVQLNGLEVYSHFHLFKRHIGFVPQDDIIHRELTVHETLMYVARLRLPEDMTEKERKTRVWETLIELELEEQERLAVARLSGGQRKRVNIAIELLTKPGVLFLDEPTSGLDPALDEKLMLLFRKLAQDGRITILTTHLLEHANMFSKIALMHYGHLIFFGTPAQALEFFSVGSLSALYSRIKEKPVEEWLEGFQKTDEHQHTTVRLREKILPSKRKEVLAPEHRPETFGQQLSQWWILSNRYLNIILRDQKNTGILLLQAPLIAFFIWVATTNLASRLFMMTLAALWFGCNNSAREICKELALYRRERMVNLCIVPYLCSKFLILTGLVILQCLVLALLTPDRFLVAYWPLLFCGLAGIAMGLFVSSIVDSPDKAIALIPIILIPQVLFSGIFGELVGVQKAFGQFMISKWSYNLVKKEFNLPTFDLKERLEDEMDENQRILKESQEKLEDLQAQLQKILDDMSETHDPSDLDMLRYDADRISRNLRIEQKKMDRARKKVQEVESDLRANARLFVWVDHPGSTARDWLMLLGFTIAFLTFSAMYLRHKDKMLQTL